MLAVRLVEVLRHGTPPLLYLTVYVPVILLADVGQLV